MRSCTKIIKDEGALETTSRASLRLAATKFRHSHLELVFHSHRGCFPLCPSVVARNIAILLMADLRPIGGPEIWSENHISIPISSRIPYTSTRMVAPWKHNRSPKQLSCSENSPH